MVNNERKRYERALSLVNQISGTILEERDYQGVLNEIIERVAQTFDARAGSIAVPDEDGEYLEFIAGFNREPSVLKRLNTTHRLRTDEGVVGHAYTNEVICPVTDVFEDDLFDEKYQKQARKEGIRAIFSVPLIAFGDCIGVVSLYYGEPREFDRRLHEIMKMVSKQVAIAMLQSNLIEDLEKSNDRLKRLAETDGLTGLPNHRKIQEIFRHEMDRAQRYDHPLSLMMIDIDHFKQINDRYGHPAGDEVLKRLSSCFEESTREIDAVGRYGGEEFMFVVPETEESKAAVLANRLRERVEELEFEVEDETLSLTVSIGIGSRDFNGDDPDEMIERADAALIHAKRSGRNQVKRYSEINSSPAGEPPTESVGS
jgi:diguanylate cyclase (GGDEF)-like protein